MLITADWVLPIHRPPIPDGGIVINGGRIVDVGSSAELAPRYPDCRVYPHEGCTLLPGLVNAHTHMAMTCLKGLIEPMAFPDWIARIPRAFNALDADDIAASITLGTLRSLTYGVTAIGDIAYGPESIAIATDAGVGGAFYWEVLGIGAEEIEGRLANLGYPDDPVGEEAQRYRFGLSPHAPYTSGPDLIRALHARAVAHGAGWVIHAAESTAETELLERGSGPFAPLAARLARGFRPPATGALAYLDSLGALDGAVAVHLTQVGGEDLAPLARKAAGAVLCPRSNEYLHNGTPPVRELRDAGVRIAIGTDSLASNVDLDLWAEARALRAIEPSLTAEEIVAMVTIEGARVLGLAPQFGTLEPGTQADFAAYRTPASEDPHAALLEHAGRGSIASVMSAGLWRMIEGSPTFTVSLVERAAHLAGQKAALALG